MNVDKEIRKQAERDHWFAIGIRALRLRNINVQQPESVDKYAKYFDLLPSQKMYLHQILKGL